MENKLIPYFLVLNVGTFILMGMDKRWAVKNKKRISEFSFSIMSFLGGVVGIVMGMFFFKHKTLKVSFHFKIFSAFIIFMVVFFGLLKNIE